MTQIQRLLYKLRVPLLILLPLWVAAGRMIFGAGGWLLLVTVFVVGPILFIGLLTIFLLTKRRPDIIAKRSLPPKDATYMSVIYVTFFLYGFLVDDGGDTAVSEGSAATKLFHTPPSDALNMVGEVCLCIGIASLVGYATYSIYAIRRKR